MSDIKNLIKEKKQQNIENKEKTNDSEGNNTKKKPKEENPKAVKKVDENWNEDVYPEYSVNVKHIDELRSKKAANDHSKCKFFLNARVISILAHGISSGWEDSEIHKVNQQEEPESCDLL